MRQGFETAHNRSGQYDGYVQMVVLGAIVIVGVLLDRLRRERG